VIGEASKKGYR